MFWSTNNYNTIDESGPSRAGHNPRVGSRFQNGEILGRKSLFSHRRKRVPLNCLLLANYHFFSPGIIDADNLNLLPCWLARPVTTIHQQPLLRHLACEPRWSLNYTIKSKSRHLNWTYQLPGRVDEDSWRWQANDRNRCSSGDMVALTATHRIIIWTAILIGERSWYLRKNGIGRCCLCGSCILNSCCGYTPASQNA